VPFTFLHVLVEHILGAVQVKGAVTHWPCALHVAGLHGSSHVHTPFFALAHGMQKPSGFTETGLVHSPVARSQPEVKQAVPVLQSWEYGEQEGERGRGGEVHTFSIYVQLLVPVQLFCGVLH
jgi:hypothetical protein